MSIEAQLRSDQTKAMKEKVMFLSAVAKPRYDPHRKVMWDGKLGLWPFAKQVPAQRSSANRPAGTLEWKSYNVDRKAYRTMMIEKLLPAIKEKWPPSARSGLHQQEVAPASRRWGNRRTRCVRAHAERD